jgi:hypothetical protein
VVKLWPYPAAFQIFHLAVISSAVFIFNKYSPFNRLQKLFFTFSYFVLFEYGIISRDSSMLLLLLFFSVYLITREKRHSVLIALSLLLLANHHLYGVFFSISLYTYIVFHIAGRAKEFTPKEKKSLFISGLLLATGAIYIFLQYYLLIKFNRYSADFGQAPYFMTLRSIWNAFFPIPKTGGIHFWNTNIFPFPYMFDKNSAATEFVSAGNIVATAFSLLILSAGVVIFSRKIPVMIVFILNTLMQLLFLQYASVFYIRYQGPLFMIFIYSYWLLSHSDNKLPWYTFNNISHFFNRPLFISMIKSASPFLTFILSVQFCSGIFCYIQDARYPFTASYEAAKYIKDKKLNSGIMVGYIDYVAQAISGHLNQKMYYPQSGNFGTHVKWLDPNRREIIPIDEAVEKALSIHGASKKNVLLLLHIPLTDDRLQPIKYASFYNNTINYTITLKYLDEFTKTIVPDEQYFLYLITHEP